MIWGAVGAVLGVMVALMAIQTTLILYIITDFKRDVNRRLDRLEEHLFPERTGPKP
jgi:hypothetical protein